MQSRYSKNTLYTEVSGRFKISMTVAWVEVKCFWQSSLLELDSAKHFSICSWALLNQSPEVTSLLTASLQLLEVTPLVGTSPLPQPLTHMMEQTYGMTYPCSAVGLASYWRTVSICKWHMAADAHGSSPAPYFKQHILIQHKLLKTNTTVTAKQGLWSHCLKITKQLP